MTGRAVVLGGGGVLGIAWEIGVLAGLAARGVDLREADLVVGTSAGALVGAQLAAGLDLEQLYAGQLAPPVAGERAPKASPLGIVRMMWHLSRSRTPQEYGARMGRIALAARTATEDERRVEVARWLGDVREWPAKRLVVTAVDAESGEPADFDAGSGVALLDAVCAGMAGPGLRPPVTIGRRRYIDGGIRSPANVHLAAGYDRVVVVAPVTRGGGVVPGVERQIAELGDGVRVALVAPDPVSWREVTGRSLANLLDPARRPAAARHGRSMDVGETVAAVWHT
ncbi:patatin-like phospholipase family protein [Nonomuraea sp. SYSU D8015]|uniref:patatin-like phospholipase family protein n=1 Tax=Nonomuraea sp. SYSU D8015 TaxID=2593644 RepID=UPI0016613FB3|nr:patatin-like phospholipase family protein [Nonomuraea sp. SYSU D8015]